MELSPLGIEFLEICKGLNDMLQQASNWLLAKKEKVEGEIKILTTYGPFTYIFPDFLKGFLKKWPSVRISCSSVSASAAVQEDVLAGKCDLGLIVGPSKWPSLKIQHLFANNVVYMVCSPDYFVANKGRLTTSDIQKATLLLHTDKRGRTLQMILKKLKLASYEGHNIMNVPDMLSAKELALKGVGIGFIANMYIQDELKGKRLIKLNDFEIKNSFNLISRDERYESPAITTFKREFVAYCRKLDEQWKE
jgi:DNA-binding transcriptional LysR family regulator